MSEEREESRIEITGEKRKTNFNIRFIPEVEISPNAWIKLKNGEPITSKTLNAFHIIDPETDEMVNLQLYLDHVETVIKRVVTYSAESEGSED